MDACDIWNVASGGYSGFYERFFHFLLIWLCGLAVYFTLPKRKSMIRLLLAGCLGIISVFGSGCLQDHVKLVDIFQGVALSWIVREVVMYEPRGKIAIVINKIGTWLSAPSYSIYLSHMLVMIVLANVIFTPSAGATVDRQYMTTQGVLTAFTKIGCFEVMMLIGSLVVAVLFGLLLYFVAERPWWRRFKLRCTLRK